MVAISGIRTLSANLQATATDALPGIEMPGEIQADALQISMLAISPGSDALLGYLVATNINHALGTSAEGSSEAFPNLRKL